MLRVIIDPSGGVSVDVDGEVLFREVPALNPRSPVAMLHSTFMDDPDIIVTEPER